MQSICFLDRKYQKIYPIHPPCIIKPRKSALNTANYNNKIPQKAKKVKNFKFRLRTPTAH